MATMRTMQSSRLSRLYRGESPTSAGLLHGSSTPWAPPASRRCRRRCSSTATRSSRLSSHPAFPTRCLQGLDKVGVHGFGVLADGLRKPAAVKHPLLEAADWRGITFGTAKSEGQARPFRHSAPTRKRSSAARAMRRSALARYRGLIRLFSTTAATGWRKLHRT